MPNHITTRITFEGERADLDALFAHIRNDETESPIDFDQILPMPKELEGTTSPWKGEPFEKSRDPAMVKRQYALEAKYGHGDWYSWSCENWGTKWNAYDVSRTGDAVEFDTAWACPLPVLTAISAAHPQVRLVVQFADEDIGSNCGAFDMQKGVLVWRKQFPRWDKMSAAQKEEAQRFACSVKGDDYDEFCRERDEG